jgi:hypothetical protein
VGIDNAAKLDGVSDYTLFARTNGIFLGVTDQTGYVMPQPRFSSAGQYWLIAVKDGFAPAVTQITVNCAVKATPVPQSLKIKPTAASRLSLTN